MQKSEPSRTETSLRHRNRNGTIEILPGTLEKSIFGNVDDDDQISRLSSVSSRVSLMRYVDSLAVVDACGNRERHHFIFFLHARPVTYGTRLVDDRSRSAARRAGLLHRKKSRALPDLPRSLTRGTGFTA